LGSGVYLIAGESLAVGRDSGDPVTQDYRGERPYRFTGSTINRVAVDVSREPYIDLEREAHAMLMREELSAPKAAATQREHEAVVRRAAPP
jgi:arylsulfatase